MDDKKKLDRELKKIIFIPFSEMEITVKNRGRGSEK